jgi:hypothetical protein
MGPMKLSIVGSRKKPPGSPSHWYSVTLPWFSPP